ncbi:hypothetical protein YC2023_001179 [Brassica napus]
MSSSPWNHTYYTNTTTTPTVSPSPWNQNYSPYYKSPWIYQTRTIEDDLDNSLIRYDRETRSSYIFLGCFWRSAIHWIRFQNIRVWKDLKDFSGFKSTSGLSYYCRDIPQEHRRKFILVNGLTPMVMIQYNRKVNSGLKLSK